LSANRSAALALNSRGIVLSSAGKKARLLEHFGHVGGGNLINAVTQIELAAGSQLQYLRLQDLCAQGQLLARVQATIATDAQLQMSNLELGGALSRLDTRIGLNGENARFDVHGLTAIKARAHCDHQLEIVHNARNTTSTQAFRAVVDERARSVFAGKVIVRPGADGADAKQSTRNLLLSVHAEVDAKPELEIHADEVKCTHGATVGQLDERALFYLRTRGIDEATARSMLLRAFVDELLTKMGNEALVAPLRARFESRFLA
jgi:Fe-S cluster assembly protein SufD